MINKIKGIWRKAVAHWLAVWGCVRPGPEAAKGAMTGAIVAAVAMAAWFGGTSRIGFTTAGDIALAEAIALLILWVCVFLTKPVLGLLRMIPVAVVGTLAGSFLVLVLPIDWPQLAAICLLLASTLGATLFSLKRGDKLRRAFNLTILGLSAAGAATLIWLWIWPGYDRDGADAPLSKQQKVDPLDLANPGEPGPHEVVRFTYAAGTDRTRPEFGSQTTIKSRSVDGSKLLKEKEGWRGTVRKRYWGFGPENLPLNGRVWMPAGAGPFPLVLIVHGNHTAEEYSDPGYAYLGELLASRGFILASIDENFLNQSWSGDYEFKEQPARGWLLLEHLKLWREWNGAKDHRLEGKVDLGRIALMGHSRGGEAAATAAAFNKLPRYPGDGSLKFEYDFNIRSVVAIAPVDGQYKPAGMWRPLRDINYFVIQGGYDYDVSSFSGARQYDRTSFSPGYDGFKSELWIYRANHGQFNTVWGKWDDIGPPAWMFNLKPLISGEHQRQVANVFISAFLEATLHDKREYRMLFEDYRRGARWLPDTTYLNRYQDARFHPIAQYDEDFDLGSTTDGGKTKGENLATWKEDRIDLRDGDRANNGVFLGWRGPASYTIQPKQPVEGTLVFSLADANADPPKEKNDKSVDPEPPKVRTPLQITIELQMMDGSTQQTTLSNAGPVYPPLRVDYEKWKVPGTDHYKKDTEPVLQRYRIPIQGKMKSVLFRFVGPPNGSVIVDDVGFERE